MLCYLIFFILFLTGNVSGQCHGDPCIKINENKTGVCKLLEDCPSAKNDFDNGIKPQICSFVGSKSVVCCPKETPQLKSNVQRISAEKCEAYEKLTFKPALFTNDPDIKRMDCTFTASLVVGGEKTNTGDYPHMVAIGYGNADLNQIRFACGGSLISERFVLTAAHCLRKKIPVVVRLGDQNLYSHDDGAEPQEFKVKRIMKHEGYSKKSNYDDIGLIELDGEVTISSFVRPACLWQEEQIPSKTATATGWGLLEYFGSASDELQEVSLTLMQNEQCNPYFAHIVRHAEKLKQGIVDGQICAAAIEGGRLVGGKDTCQGDSGGPLQITLEANPCLFYVVGVTSFSSIGCGGENSPGVYTRVSEYLDWIEANVWPEEISRNILSDALIFV